MRQMHRQKWHRRQIVNKPVTRTRPMMRSSKMLLTAAILSFIAVSFFSCAKKEVVNTPYTRLFGKWKKVRFATDDNANGVIDDWEFVATDKNITNTLLFKSDSTGTEATTNAPDLSFRWFIGGDVSLYLIYATGDTFTYNVVENSAAHLYLTTKSKIAIAGYYYDRTN